jgi:DNA-binding CsgD family transcriptional regulator
MRLTEGECARVGRFVAEAATIWSDEEPFPVAFLDALGDVVACDDVCFAELDRVRHVYLGGTETTARTEWPEPEVTYWEIRHEHPACHHHETSGSWPAHRVTDFVTHRQLRRSRIYAQWFRPLEVEHQITVGIDSPLSHTKVFLLSRSSGRDFTRGDCDVLDVIRPYLAGRYELWASLRRRADAEGEAGLTARERQVLDLVADGMKNAEIARLLWISPGTVRRHLENAYAKLGVHTRTAAVRVSRRSH